MRAHLARVRHTLEALGSDLGVIFVSEHPTPIQVPVFNGLADRSIPLLVIYLNGGSRDRGWGTLEINHPHLIANRNAILTSLFLVCRLCENRKRIIFAPFGYRGILRISGLVASRLCGVQVVTRSDSNLDYMTRGGRLISMLRKLILRCAFPKSTRVWTIGDENEKVWTEFIGHQNVVRIPYSVPVLPGEVLPLERRTDGRRLRVLYVGRLQANKSVDDLIAAFKLCDPKLSREWGLDIVGQGPETEKLKLAAGPDQRIEFHGAQEFRTLGAFYGKADVLVLPSRHEAWGLVVSEALAFGCRVIVSDRVGAKEEIVDESVGRIYPYGDVRALADAIVETLNFPQRTPRSVYDPTEAMTNDLKAIWETGLG